MGLGAKLQHFLRPQCSASLSARTVISPLPPHVLVVTSASATNRAAPRAELVSSRDCFAIPSPLGQIRDSEDSDETILHGCSSHRSEPTNNRAPAADRLRGLVSLKRQLPTAAASNRP
jgi:hypothetical protein